MAWSAEQYSRFEAERNRPIADLLARLPIAGVRRAVDIGCGPGNSTERLRARYPDAEISGIDTSSDMIAAARKRLPDVDFSVVDIAAWADPGPFDLILANAALQWVPDHAALLPALIAKLAPGGHLAAQMPDNLGEPSHLLMRRVAEQPRWAGRLDAGWADWANRHPADWYYRALHGTVASLDIWRTTYFHPLGAGADAIVDMFRGSALRPFLALLDEVEQAEFLAAYRDEIALAYPALADGTVALPFPRLFVIATR